MSESVFISAVTTTGNIVSASLLAARLRITEVELAAALGLSSNFVSRKTLPDARISQSRMQDMVEIVDRVLQWAGSELAAFTWYRSQSLPSFGDRTASDLVGEDRGEAIKAYLNRIAEGDYA